MKKLTINEIAEMVGVSKTTISFYLNGKTNKMSDETQKKIQQVIEETGYTPVSYTHLDVYKRQGGDSTDDPDTAV